MNQICDFLITDRSKSYYLVEVKLSAKNKSLCHPLCSRGLNKAGDSFTNSQDTVSHRLRTNQTWHLVERSRLYMEVIPESPEP